MSGRVFSSAAYRYGFNNQEKDSELGDAYAFEYRIHDARLGRFLSVDPLAPKFPFYSSFQFCSNSPIMAVEIEGLESSSVGSNETEKPNTSSTSNPTDEEKFLSLITLPKEPLKPEKSLETWRKENAKPRKKEFKSKQEFKAAKEQDQTKFKAQKKLWDNYNYDYSKWTEITEAVQQIAKGGTSNFKEIRDIIVAGGVKLTITMNYGGSDDNHFGTCTTSYNTIDNENIITGGLVNVDVGKLNTGNPFTEATKEFDKFQPPGKLPKTATVMGILMHELGHFSYDLKNLKSSTIDEKYKEATESHAIGIELKTYYDGY